MSRTGATHPELISTAVLVVLVVVAVWALWPSSSTAPDGAASARVGAESDPAAADPAALAAARSAAALPPCPPPSGAPVPAGPLSGVRAP